MYDANLSFIISQKVFFCDFYEVMHKVVALDDDVKSNFLWISVLYIGDLQSKLISKRIKIYERYTFEYGWNKLNVCLQIASLCSWSTMTLKSQISISKLVYWLSITDRYLTKLLHTKNYQRLNWPKQTKCPTLLPMPNPYKILFEFKTK